MGLDNKCALLKISRSGQKDKGFYPTSNTFKPELYIDQFLLRFVLDFGNKVCNSLFRF